MLNFSVLYSIVNSLLICAQVYYSYYLIHLYSEQLNEALRDLDDNKNLDDSGSESEEESSLW